VKIRQQKELSESIISKIQKELENPRVLQQILQQSVADVESKSLLQLGKCCTNISCRDCCIQGTIDCEGVLALNVSFITLVDKLLCHSLSTILP
jgi:hypothetical protein